MADAPISSLTALNAAPFVNDKLIILDISDTSQAPTGTTKSILTSYLFTDPTIAGLTVTGTANFYGALVARDELTVINGASCHSGLSIQAGGLIVTSGTASFGDEILASASTTARATLNIPHGSAPTSPVNGDMWTTTSGLFVRINGSTVGPLT